jgi:hypothetical protein
MQWFTPFEALGHSWWVRLAFIEVDRRSRRLYDSNGAV